ncbi:hypothetical protein BB65665_01484, partial [Bacillus sp. 916]
VTAIKSNISHPKNKKSRIPSMSSRIKEAPPLQKFLRVR